ncbi:MAG: hypothetical protein P9X22_04155 [Candidatus Zapsychrus exili]|nr:hypothetical protein [Candidatus Zapsychrus exili]
MIKRLFKTIGSKKFLSVCILCAIGLYALLCFTHYFNQRPLWNDEACIFDNVKSLSTKEVFSVPLKSFQVFPRAYLFVIQKVSSPFGYHLLSLRFLSFVFMLLAFFAWQKIAKNEIKDIRERFIFTLSWAASGLLIYYSAELKQYSLDVLVAAVYLLFLYNQDNIKHDKIRYVACLILLPFLGLFSYPSFMFMMIPLYNLVLDSKKDKDNVKFVFIYLASFIVVFLTSYFFDMRLRDTAVLTSGWGDYFVSFKSARAFLSSFGEGISNLFSRFFAEKPRYIKSVVRCFVVIGFVNLFHSFFTNIKREDYYLKSVKTIGFVLFIELFILGVLKKYPFTVPRTSLFFAPVVLYLTIDGIQKLKNINIYLYRIIYFLYILFLIYMVVGLSRNIFLGDLGGMPTLWRQY